MIKMLQKILHLKNPTDLSELQDHHESNILEHFGQKLTRIEEHPSQTTLKQFQSPDGWGTSQAGRRQRSIHRKTAKSLQGQKLKFTLQPTSLRTSQPPYRSHPTIWLVNSLTWCFYKNNIYWGFFPLILKGILVIVNNSGKQHNNKI